jgi:hypothetical protein
MKLNRMVPIVALAALPLIATSGVAQTQGDVQGSVDAYTQLAQRADPDPNVRLEMSRDNYRFKKKGDASTPRLFAGTGITQGNDVFDCMGQYVGSDPDPTVRARLLQANAGDACK